MSARTNTRKKSGKSGGTKKSNKKSQSCFKLKIAATVLITIALAVSIFFADPIELALGLRSEAYIESAEEFDAEGSSAVAVVKAGEAVFHYIDVGQGDSIMLHMPQETADTDDGGAIPGTYILIDGGSENKDGKHASTNPDGSLKVMSYLKATIGQIDNFVFDYVIASHEHEDHVGGLPAVLNEYPAKIIYRPNAQSTYSSRPDPLIQNAGSITVAREKLWGTPTRVSTKTYSEFLAAAYKTRFLSDAAQITKEVRVSNATDSTQNTIKGTNSTSADYFELRLHTPLNEKVSNANNNSPIISVTYRNRRVMLSGDAESKVEKEFVNAYRDTNFGTADIIQAGHHGSTTSSSREYLEFLTTAATRPNTFIIISVGVGNTYKHPATATLERLADMGFSEERILRTDLNGTIVLSISQENGETVIKFGAEAVRSITEDELPVRWWQIAATLWVICLLAIWGGMKALKKIKVS